MIAQPGRPTDSGALTQFAIDRYNEDVMRKLSSSHIAMAARLFPHQGIALAIMIGLLATGAVKASSDDS